MQKKPARRSEPSPSLRERAAEGCDASLSDIARMSPEEALARFNATLAEQVAQRTASLQESERMARSVVDGLSAHIAIVDQRGCIVSVNERWRDFAVQNGGTLISVCEGANYLDACAAAGRSGCAEAVIVAAGIREVLAGKRQELAAEYPCHSPTEQRWFVARVTRFPGEGPPRVLVAHENITTRVKAEHALQESEARLRLSVQSANIGLWDWNLITDEVYFSPEWKSQLGFADDEIRPHVDEWRSRVHPDDVASTMRKVKAFIAKPKGGYEIEFRLRHKDGSYRWIHAKGDLTRDAAGKPVRMLGCHIDFTERRQATEVLRNREERLRTILNTVVDSIITIDAQGTMTGVNPATERMFGYTEAEMLGKNVKMLMPSPFREEHDQYLENYLRTGDARIIGIGREAQARRKDGTIFPVDLAVSAVDHLQLYTGVIRDITQRRELEAEVLRISEDERHRVAADLHDGICQEIAGISLMVNVLRRDLQDGKDELVGKARWVEDALSDAVEHTRQVARGMSPVVPDGSGLMYALTQLTENIAHSGRIHCAFECKTPVVIETPKVANELYRITQEAVHNAIRHGHGDRITVRLSERHGEVTLTVTDNGRGIPDAISHDSGMGLRVMKYRADLIGARLTIRPHKSGGTEVTCSITKPKANP